MEFILIIFAVYSLNPTVQASESACTEHFEYNVIYPTLQPPIYRNQYDDYNDPRIDEYDDPRIDEYDDPRIIGIDIICHNISFPVEIVGKSCDDCTKTLTISSAVDNVMPALSFSDYFDVLFLDGVGIEIITPGAFGEHKIKKIHLSHNNISDISVGIFNSLIELEYLDLSHNNIATIMDNSFLNLKYLKYLLLSYNNLTNFSTSILDPFVSMEKLDLGDNNISNISIPNEIEIAVFKLNNNQIRSLGFCPFFFKEIFLQNNLLGNNFTSNCTHNVYETFTINLSNNNISLINLEDFYHATNLRHLNLSHNILARIEFGTFDHLERLESLDVSYNKLEKITNVLVNLKSLKSLYFQNNNIKTISDEFIYNSALQNINLDDNKFDCLNLIEVIRKLKSKLVNVKYGRTKSTSNVFGISCESFKESTNVVKVNKTDKYFENILITLLKNVTKQSQEQDVYLRKEFEKSELMKFFKNFQIKYSNFNESDFYIFFNSEFKNSSFFKNLNNFTEINEKLVNNFQGFFEAFINITLTKYLEDIKNYKLYVKDMFLNSTMYTYFNKNFENSEFKTYLNNLRTENMENVSKLKQIINKLKQEDSEFCLIFFIYSFITIAFNQECFEENEMKQKSVPPHYEYIDGIERFVDYKDVIVHSNLTCYDVQLPMTYHRISKHYENATTYLIITSLKTTIIPPLSFQNVVKFDYLILDNLGVQKLMPSAFSSKSLKRIFLSNNNLTEIGLGIFNHLTELEFLDLSNNNIKTIQEHSFLGLVHLKSLILSNNQLKNLPFSVLDPNIISMDLLDISSNILENISLENDFIINEFKVSNNKLKTIDFCPVIFTKLSLNNNSIYTLPLKKCLNQTNRLKVLDVSYNKISNLEGLILENSILTQLDISNNNISFISTDFFYNMVFLTDLNISHNSIKYFQHGIFDHISELNTLDASFNVLSKVDSFYPLSNLIDLYINNNNINYINPPDFFRDLPKLRLLSVDDNKLPCSNLIEIMRFLKKTPVNLNYGHTKSSSNIHGIACEENDVFDSKPDFEHFLSTLLKDMSRQSKNNVDALKDYFQGDFKNSSFYKFMENFQNSERVRLDDTGMYKYFNNNFNQSKFYEYLESLKDTEYSINFAKNVTDFIEAIKNNKSDKYLKNYKIKGDDEVFDKQMFNYFNKDFEKSEFFKYLENLRTVSHKNLPQYENFDTGYTKLFVSNMFTLFFMIVICCLLGILVYEFVFVVKSRKPETVELVNDEI